MLCILLSFLRNNLPKLLSKLNKIQRFHNKWLKTWINYWSLLKKIRTIAISMWDPKATEVKPVKDHWNSRCTKTSTRKNLQETAFPKRIFPLNQKNLNKTKLTWWNQIFLRKKKKLQQKQKKKIPTNCTKKFGKKMKKQKGGRRKKEKKRRERKNRKKKEK